VAAPGLPEDQEPFMIRLVRLRKPLLAATLAAAVALPWAYHPGGAATARAADDPTKSTMGGSGPLKDELDPATRAAVDKGLSWLSKNLNAEGAISGAGGDSAGIIALSGLAFLAGGSMPGDGPYGKDVDRILEFVLKNAQESGLISSPNYSSTMYGHGFATLFLAEAYGMSQRPDLKEKLQNAVRLIVTTQNREGGWRYQPLPQDADISVTICQIMALRAARGAGIKVPPKTINDAIDYVKKSQEADGGFAYMLTSRGSAYPRSAAGVACLYYLRSGDGFADEIKKGIAYLQARLPNGPARDDGGDYHFFYGNYYATQAMFMSGGDAWKAYWPAIRGQLLKRQQTNGSWSGDSGTVYATSMALIILQVPNRLLPILQK
jgi:hypothetical protein